MTDVRQPPAAGVPAAAGPPATPGPIVLDCEVCRRVVWAGTTCSHGQVPPPGGGSPPDPHANRPRNLRGGTGR